MFVLTDGKNYVMENPMKEGEYLQTTYSVKAKQFTYKQARNLLNRKGGKKYSWIKNFRILNLETGNMDQDIPKYSNDKVFCDDKEIEFDDGIIDEINKEKESIIGLCGWSLDELQEYKAKLTQGLQFYDCAISDVRHARMGKRPSAAVMTKIDSISNELEEKRRDIKQATMYVQIMLNAVNERWTLEKLKAEMEAKAYQPYKGRTKYFQIAEDILN